MSILIDLSNIRARFKAQWNATTTITLMAEAPERAVSKSDTYVRFSINPEDIERRTMGSGGIFNGYGHIYLQVFTPKGDGTATAYEKAEAFAAIFREWRSADGKLVCGRETYTTIPSGPKTDPDYFCVKVSVPYTSTHRL